MSSQWKSFTFRRPGICVICGNQLKAGDSGFWNASRKEICCALHAELLEPVIPITAKLVPITSVVRNAPGKSALEKNSNEREREIERVRLNFGRFKPVEKVALFLRADSQKTKNWETGAVGEQIVGKKLHELAQLHGFVVLNDLRRPPTKANIDHVVINSTGVFIIDTKNYEGPIDVKYSGFFSNAPDRLIVNKRDKSILIDGVKNQISQVQAALAKAELDMPVFGVLTFVLRAFEIFIVPEKINGIFLTSNRGVGKILSVPGNYSTEQVAAAEKVIETAFPPA